MPRANSSSGPSTLRNRNRVTNKTRLRIVQGSIDADPLGFDEDEEKVRVVSTAGVDAEDANEHHLQAVLSAAARHSASVQRPTRGAAASAPAAPDRAAYIPIPDSTGTVDNYDELYPASKWTDPHHYLKTSECVEESISDALANGFTYYMDERDKDWLDKNNEEARGEGTSAQGALSTAGTATRTSQRSAKAKGKEPDVPQPVVMTEDELELVMGLFEKVTNEKTAYLHHGLESGGHFPPFSDYQDTFASPLAPDTFAAFVVPSWIPPPPQMLRYAKLVYPYWKERRIERGGHRVIPALNYDEADTQNESYVCFRRRDVKAIRKTRAAQASSSEKLVRLQQELLTTQELAVATNNRETVKRESVRHGRAVWEIRENMASMKRKFPALGVKEDEEMFFDKERQPPKKPKPAQLSIRIKPSAADNLPAMETPMRPKDRVAAIQGEIERGVLQIKATNSYWEDGIDNPHQPDPVGLSGRYWCPTITPPTSSDSQDESPRQYRAVRMRRGRGGVVRVDRRRLLPRGSRQDDEEEFLRRPRLRQSGDSSDEDSAEERERARRITERWRYDRDDEPPVGPDGPDEQDRVLVDNYSPEYLRYTMSILRPDDHQRLSTDSTLFLKGPNGQTQAVAPITRFANYNMTRAPGRPMAPPAVPNTAYQNQQQQMQQPRPAHEAGVALSMPQAGGTPISMQAQMKKSMNVPQVRLSSNGGMRSGSTPGIAQSDGQGAQLSPPHPSSASAPPMVNGHNASHTPTHVSHDMSTSSAPVADGSLPASASSASSVSAHANPAHNIPMQLKPPNPHHAITMPNGYHMNGFSSNAMQNGAQSYPAYANMQGLTMQQMQALKQFAATHGGQQQQDLGGNGGAAGMPSTNGSRPAAYMGHVAPNGANYNLPLAHGVNVNTNHNLTQQQQQQQQSQGMRMGAGMNLDLKLPASRQMQWAASQQPQQSAPVGDMNGNGIQGGMRRTSSGNLSHGHLSASPHLTPQVQGRVSPAALAAGAAHGAHGISMSHSMSPHLQNRSPANVSLGMGGQGQQSPPRPGQGIMSSPSLQHQHQPVNGSGSTGTY